MKKLLFAVALITLMGSCKKDYTCNCVFTDRDPADGFLLEGTASFPLGKQTKNDAESSCDANNETDLYTVTTCTLSSE